MWPVIIFGLIIALIAVCGAFIIWGERLTARNEELDQ
jgi:hypothetical protein